MASHKSGLAICGRLLEWSRLLYVKWYFDGYANGLAQSLVLETVPGFRCWSPHRWDSVSCESWTSMNAPPRLVKLLKGQTIHIQLFCSCLWCRSYSFQALPSKAATPSAAPSYPAPSCASLIGFHRLPRPEDSPDSTESSRQSASPKI